MFQRTKPVYIPPPPQNVQTPSHEIYERMGEENIFLMLEDFYLELGESSIRYMFPPDMRLASQKSAAFFVGLMGGPPLYHQRYGNPMMRARHISFEIDETARQIWLGCFERVLDRAVERYDFPAEHLADFRAFLVGFSSWMVNTKDEAAPTKDVDLFAG